MYARIFVPDPPVTVISYIRSQTILSVFSIIPCYFSKINCCSIRQTDNKFTIFVDIYFVNSDSIRAALPLTGEPEDIDGEYVMMLAIKLNERVQELRGVRRKISVLERELGL